MSKTRRRDALVLAGCLALFFWATLPPAKVAFNESCEPQGGPATFSALIYRGSFWQAQLNAAIAERNDLLTQPYRRERNEEEIKRQMSEDPSLEEKMMRLSRDQDRIDDTYERERHEAAIQNARLKRITTLMRCEAVIAEKLK